MKKSSPRSQSDWLPQAGMWFRGELAGKFQIR